ncbi:MAG: isopenicillin N synthase family oxygenase [Alphaproteobacteria bacterium]|jgi:isopenicillin N synthase-like dioxygenase|nr:isopenicillin N synthase family oxygenase [Alphaproteobacteria bacterium]
MTSTATQTDPTPRQAAAEEIPLIDLTPLRDGGAAGRDAVAAEIGRACRGLGFFYVTGHGIPEDVRDGVFAAARRFFALPDPAKRALAIEHSPHNRGYVGLAGESLDPAIPADRKEAFNIGLDLAPDDPEVVAGAPFRGVNQWPDLPGWRATLLDYFERMRALATLLHRAIAVDLGAAPDVFEPLVDRPMATLRLLHYPAEPPAADGAIGAGAHTDYGNVTILATDGVPGLEVRTRGGEWVAAPHVPGAFVCNIGDLLMRWSNDVYVSTPHRVVNRTGQERYSIAFFFDPNPDAAIACLPSCVDADRPARYPPTTGAAYLAERLDATYAFRGKDG